VTAETLGEETLLELVRELNEATARLDMARANLAHANREETAAINRYNAATKAIDKYHATLRQKAPRGTDWCDQQRHGRPVQI
jgi:hypothetical protein